MDEKEFFARWGAAARNVCFEVPDVRRAVWDRIAGGAPGETAAGELSPFFEPSLFLKLDCAAAVVILAGAGVIYSLLSDFSSLYYWSMPFNGLAHGYF